MNLQPLFEASVVLGLKSCNTYHYLLFTCYKQTGVVNIKFLLSSLLKVYPGSEFTPLVLTSNAWHFRLQECAHPISLSPSPLYTA